MDVQKNTLYSMEAKTIKNESSSATEGEKRAWDINKEETSEIFSKM